MKPYTERIPKTLIPAAGRPFAAHQLDWLSAHGVHEVVYCIGHLGAMVRDFVGDASRWGLRVRYVEDGDGPAGTAGALRRALDGGVLEDRFVVQYGDSFLPFDVAAFYHAFLRCGRPAMMTVFHNPSEPAINNVDYADGVVRLYDKTTKAPMAWIDYGMTAFLRDLIESHIPATGPCDLADVTHRLSRSGLLAGYEVAERFHEIGSPAGLAEFEQWIAAT
jgi:NDP-sugar pyrophosphorylase family protein